MRGIYDADGDGIDANDPYSDVVLQVKVEGKDIRVGGEAKIPNHQQAQAHDPIDPDDDLGLTPMPDAPEPI